MEVVKVVKEEGQITRNEMNQNFKTLYENLTLFISTKDRIHPTTFVVFTAEKGTKAKTKGKMSIYNISISISITIIVDNVKKVTEAMYEVLNKEKVLLMLLLQQQQQQLLPLSLILLPPTTT